jgi:prepilin-type N-terminal cleavage/methylation domain-containing protein
MNKRGFTIVELLIVIVVIAILAAISIVAYTGIQERGRRSSAAADLNMLEKAIIMARVQKDKTLLQITGSNCTYCIGGQAGYEAALDAIGSAAGMNLDGLKKGDPWGVRYRIDENEGEGTVNPPCGAHQDNIAVADSSRGLPIIRIPYYQPGCG